LVGGAKGVRAGAVGPKVQRPVSSVGAIAANFALTPKPPAVNRRTYLFLGVAALLLLPAVAMLFTDEVRWSPFDFVVAAVMLGGTAFVSDLIWGRLRNRRTRLIALAVVLFLLVLVWGELAVGLFGTPWAGN